MIKEWLNSKLFNGYVVSPIPIFFISLITLVSLWIIAFSLTAEIFPSNQITETMCINTVVTSWADSDPMYNIDTADGIEFSLIKGAANDNLLEILVLTKKTVTIEYIPESLGRDGRYDILSLFSDDGQISISGDVVTTATSQNNKESLWIVWSITLSLSSLAGISYYILCNAPRYPRIASLLIRKAYRRF